MAPDLEIKRGDTLDHFANYELVAEDGALLDPTDWAPASQILFADGSRATLTVDKIGDSILRIRSATLAWPVGRAYLDVQFTGPGGFIVSSPTLYVRVIEDITLNA